MFQSFRLIRNALTNVTIRGLKSIRSIRGQGSLEDVKKGSNEATVENVVKALEDVETKDANVKSYSFRGTNFHKSHKDPTETEDILSVRLFSDVQGSEDAYLQTLHIRKDGSYKSNKKE